MDVEVVGKFLSTLPEDDDHPYRTGPWRPQTTEWDADDLTVVEGEIPHDLDGVYLRNTENPLHPSLKFYHPFDGDGMIHVVGFRDGKAFYRYGWSSSSGSVDRYFPTISTLAVVISCSAHDETDGGGGAAAEVQRAERLCALDLVVARPVADLLGGVEQHPNAGRADGMPAADQPAAGVDRQPTADLDLAVLDGLPRFAGTGQADVVDGEVLAGGEAVVHLEAVDVVEGDMGAVERVEHRPPHMGHHVRIVRRAVELLLQAQADGAVAPAVDPADRPRIRVVAQVVVGDENDARTAVGHLAAVEAAQPALDDRVDLIVDGGVAVAARRSGTVQSRVCALGLVRALAKLSWAIARRWISSMPYRRSYSSATWANMCGHMNLASAPSWPVHAAAPRYWAAVSPGTVFSSSTPTTSAVRYAPDRRSAMAARVGDAARCAGGFVAGGRGVPQPVVNGGGHRAEVSLPGEHLAEGVGDVHHVDRRRRRACAAASVESTTSAVRSAKSSPSRVRLRLKSL